MLLRSRVKSLEARVTDQAGRIDRQRDKIFILKSDIDSQRDKIFILQSDLAMMHAKLNSQNNALQDMLEKFEAVVKQQRIRFVEVPTVERHVVARADRG